MVEPKMDLRPYQQASIDRLRAARRSGARRLLLASPTGSGKTVLACHMIRTALGNGLRILVIAHRRELLDQFWRTLRGMGIDAGIIRADDSRTDPSLPVQLGSVASLVRRDAPPADLVIVDEAHRAPGDSYQRILSLYPSATVIGLSATPCRLDGRPLGEHFDVLVEGARYSDLIESGAILAPIVYAPKREPDLSKVRKVAGDYNEGDLEAAMRQPHVIGSVVEEWNKRAEGRSTVIFAVGIAHSKEIVEDFRAAGIKAAHLDGSTSEDERDQILVDLEVGKLQVVSNVGVLCEGWDQPRVKCCVMARPTLSLTLYMQCVGRILRPWGTQAPIVLDHAGNASRHGLPHEDREWSLDGKVKRREEIAYHVCKACYGYVDEFPCPLCGAGKPAGKPRTMRKADGVLERIDAQIAKEHEDPKRVYFDARVEEARRKGFKPGYASAKYKEKHGAWPPWAWSQGVLATLDDEWKEKIAKRETERAFWQALKKKNEEDFGGEYVPPPDVEDAPL